MQYKYLDTSTPHTKIDYSYAKFQGKDFLEAWRKSRIDFIGGDCVPEITITESKPIEHLKSGDFIEVNEILDNWIFSLTCGTLVESEKIILLIKRFEVTKKIYKDYSMLMRPSSKERLASLDEFAKWGIVLALFYSRNNKYQALNALIKVNDILISHPHSKSELALQSVCKEVEIIEKLLNKKITQ